MAGFTGNPRVWSRLRFQTASTSVTEDHAFYDLYFANSYSYNGAPLVSMSISANHQRFAYATAQWTNYSGPNVRSRQYQVGQGVPDEDALTPPLWNNFGQSQATTGLTVPSTVTNASPLFELTDSTTPATGSHSVVPGWTGEYSDDGTVFASIHHHPGDQTKVYLSVKQNGTTLVTRQLLGITHRRKLSGGTYGSGSASWKTELRLMVRSATDIWIFHIDETTPVGVARLFLSVWNGASITSTTQIDLGTYHLLSFEVIRGTTGLMYLIYTLYDADNPYDLLGPVNGYAYVRTVNETTRAVSAVIHTSPRLERTNVPGDPNGNYTRLMAMQPGDRIPSNRVFAYKGTNYLIHVLAGQTTLVYTYTDAAPTVVTLLRWGFVEKLSNMVDGYPRFQYMSPSMHVGRVTGVEYDPVSDKAYLVTMIPTGGEDLGALFDYQTDVERVYVTRHWQALDAPTWNQSVELVAEMPAYVWAAGNPNAKEGTQDYLGYIPSRYGTATEGLLYTQSRKRGFGGSFSPRTHVIRIQNWHDPIDIDATVEVDARPAVLVGGGRTYEVGLLAGVGPALAVGGVRSRTSEWSTTWGQSVDTSVDGTLHIDLLPDVQVTGSLATVQAGEIEIDFTESLGISVSGEVERIFLFSHQHIGIGITFLQDFQNYMNEERQNVWGRPPVQVMGLTPLSLEALKTRDIAQVHCDNMLATRWYAHGAAVYPVGWRTAAERLRSVSDLGAENLQTIGSYFQTIDPLPTAFEVYTIWKNSPPHYANMMYDWDAAAGPDTTPYVFSTLAFSYGRPPMYNGGGPPWDSYPIVPLDPLWYDDPNAYAFYFTDNFVLIKEAYVEATLIERWQRDELLALLLEERWSRPALVRARAVHEAPYSLPISVVHVTAYGSAVTAAHTAWSTESVQREHHASYGYAVRVASAAHEGSWDLRKLNAAAGHELWWSRTLAAAHDSEYEDQRRVAAEHSAVYEEKVQVSAAHSATYDEYAKLSGTHTAEFGPTPSVSASSTALYGTPGDVSSTHTAQYAIQREVRRGHAAPAALGAFVGASTETPYALLVRNPATQSLVLLYGLSTPGPKIDQFGVRVTLNGRTYEVQDGYLTGEYESPGFVFECNVNDLEFLRGAKIQDRLDIDFAGTHYVMFLANISTNSAERSAAPTMTLSGRSPIYLLGAPYSETAAYAPDTAKMFSEIVQEVLGVPVDFSRHIDWSVPFGRAQSASQTPLASARALLESVGSRLLSNPDGSLYVLARYPHGFDALPEGTPDHQITEVDDVFTRSSTHEYSPGYNRFRVRDADRGFGDMIQFDETEGIASVWVSPYRTSWTLRCTTTPGILLDPLGEETEEQSELWDFRSGTASAAYPILDLVSVTWLTDSLGGIAFDPYSTRVTAPVLVHHGFGLAKVVYRARRSRFRLTSSAPIEATQLIIVEQ